MNAQELALAPLPKDVAGKLMTTPDYLIFVAAGSSFFLSVGLWFLSSKSLACGCLRFSLWAFIFG